MKCDRFGIPLFEDKQVDFIADMLKSNKDQIRANYGSLKREMSANPELAKKCKKLALLLESVIVTIEDAYDEATKVQLGE